MTAALRDFAAEVAAPVKGDPRHGEDRVHVRATDKHAARAMAEDYYRAAHGLASSVFVVAFVTAVDGVGR
jgi:hypothetical protein